MNTIPEPKDGVLWYYGKHPTPWMMWCGNCTYESDKPYIRCPVCGSFMYNNLRDIVEWERKEDIHG